MKSTLDQTFDEFKEWLMNLFAETHIPTNSNYINKNAYYEFEQGKKDKDGNQLYMLPHYAYTPECEQFLIKWAKFYIKVKLDRNQSHNVSLNFLEKLMNKMADYLSYYVVQKHPVPASGKSQNKLRIKVQGELKKVLFDDNDYIRAIKAQQAAKSELRQLPWEKRKKFIAAKKRVDRQTTYHQACKIKGEIEDLFNDAQRTPRGR